MMKRQLLPDTGLLALLVFVAVVSPGHCIEVTLSHLSTLYLPTYASNGTPTYTFPSRTVQQLALQPEAKLIYGVGNEGIKVIDASDVTNLTLKAEVKVSEMELTDVEVCGQGVFITYRNSTDKRQGGVWVYRTYDANTGRLEFLRNIPLGSLPDMLLPTCTCTLIVALENEGFVQEEQFYDPPGGVGIIRFPSGITAEPEVKTLNFTKFDAHFQQLSDSGVRWVYRNDNNFSDNVEPEYVAFNGDYTKAFICLQENNAIAVVDLITDNITDIYGLGFKQWGKLDPSDRDGGVHISRWPIYGMYQPDSIMWVQWGGEDYLITANEGDAQEYPDPVSFSEEIRGTNIADAEIADTVSEELRQALRNDSQLGRLTLSNVDGRNNEGKFEEFFTYGGRSFSIWRASDMAQVFDSQDEIETQLAEIRPDIFNSNGVDDKLLVETMDTRSDNEGPEIESITSGIVKNHLLIFVGIERPGIIAVYSVAPGDLSPQFQTMYAEGIPQDTRRTWSQLYDDRLLFGIDPEYIQFVPASSGLADFPMLLMAGTAAGTVSLLKVDAVTTGGDSPISACSAVQPNLLVMSLWLLTLCVCHRLKH